VVSGTLQIGLALVVHAACLFLSFVLLDVAACIGVLGGLLRILAGRTLAREFAFPLAFLIFIAPLPGIVQQWVAIELQQVASLLSASSLELCGISVFREGCYIHIPGYDMEVGVACSGLRQLAAIVALSLAVGHLSDRRPLYQAVLACLSVPVAIAANCIRITLTGVILLWFGRKWAEGVYHTLEGLVVVGLAASLVLGAAWLLAKADRIWPGLGPKRVPLEPGSVRPESPPNAVPRIETRKTRPAARIALSVILVAGSLGAQWGLERHLKAAGLPLPAGLSRPLSELPFVLGGWHGRDLPIADEIRYADQHLKRAYYRPEGKQVLSLWIAYSETGADRQHHPEVCMAVAGQPENRQLRETLAVPGHPQPVQEYRFGRTGRAQEIFYWHYTLPLQRNSQADRVQHFYQQVHYRSASVTLEVFAPATSPEEITAAREFVHLVDAAVQEHVGPGANRGSRRLPITITNLARAPE
jgi:exosortase